MKFNYIFKTDIPVSIETNLDRLLKLQSALDALKDGDQNDQISKYDIENLLKEVNQIISKVNEKFTY
jgi:hypothetical protein